MLVRIQDDWFAADQVTAVLARKDQAEHPVALLMIDGAAVPIHAQDSDTAFPTEFAAEIARTINYALDSMKLEDEGEKGDARDDDSGEKPSVADAESARIQEEMHEAWFKQGWEALAKDYFGDQMTSLGRIDKWSRAWAREHGLGHIVEIIEKAAKEEREFHEVDGHSAEAALAERAAEPVKAKDLPKRPDPERDGPDYEADNQDDDQAEGPAVRAPLVISQEAVDKMVSDINQNAPVSSYLLGRHLADRLGYKVVPEKDL